MSHESNGLDIVIALVLNDISPLSKHRMDLVMELKVKKFFHLALAMFLSVKKDRKQIIFSFPCTIQCLHPPD